MEAEKAKYTGCPDTVKMSEYIRDSGLEGYGDTSGWYEYTVDLNCGKCGAQVSTFDSFAETYNGQRLTKMQAEKSARELCDDISRGDVSAFIISAHKCKETAPAVTTNTLDNFTRSYIVAALWTETGDADEPLDKDYSIEDIAPEVLEKIVGECRAFQTANATDLAAAYELYTTRDDYTPQDCAGHDFLLTRNEHGAGFWDRGLNEVGERLTNAAHAFGVSNFYVGDDGKIYVTP